MTEKPGAEIISEREALEKCLEENKRLRARIRELEGKEETFTVKAKRMEKGPGIRDEDFTVKID